MKVAFLVNDLQLSGGIGVVLQHARRLSALEGWDVTLVLVREEEGPNWSGYDHLPHLHVRRRDEVTTAHFDIAVATWWETVFTLFELSANCYAYFVQSLEDRFYLHDRPERLGAGLTLDLPVSFITEARWIADTLAAWRPDAPCYLVRNGIDKGVFAPLERVPPAIDRPLRIVIEGSPLIWHKGVEDALNAASAMLESHRVTVICGDPQGLGNVGPADRVFGPLSHREMAEVYSEHDVLLKLSRVEGMFGPPLEGFHRGTTCVVTPVTGHTEYVEHGHNGLVSDWDDLRGTARQLDLLARDRRLLHFLRTNALATARAWPDWSQASQFMAAALIDIRRNQHSTAAFAAAPLLRDLRSGLETYEHHLTERARFERRARRLERPISWVVRIPGVRWGLRMRHTRPGQAATRLLRAIATLARRA